MSLQDTIADLKACLPSNPPRGIDLDALGRLAAELELALDALLKMVENAAR